MIPKKTYKIAVNFSKLLISYLAVGALLLLLIMLLKIQNRIHLIERLNPLQSMNSLERTEIQ